MNDEIIKIKNAEFFDRFNDLFIYLLKNNSFGFEYTDYASNKNFTYYYKLQEKTKIKKFKNLKDLINCMVKENFFNINQYVNLKKVKNTTKKDFKDLIKSEFFEIDQIFNLLPYSILPLPNEDNNYISPCYIDSNQNDCDDPCYDFIVIKGGHSGWIVVDHF